MRLLAIMILIFTLTSCVYPVIPAARVGHTPEEHAALQKKAESGDLDAQLAFGWSYCCGNDALFNNKIATKWMCSAAKKEHAEAQYKIAGLYSSRKLVIPGYEGSVKRLPPDDKVALAWFIVASKNGHAGAKEGLEMFRHMDFEDVVAAIDLSRKYPEIPCEVQ